MTSLKMFSKMKERMSFGKAIEEMIDIKGDLKNVPEQDLDDHIARLLIEKSIRMREEFDLNGTLVERRNRFQTS